MNLAVLLALFTFSKYCGSRKILLENFAPHVLYNSS